MNRGAPSVILQLRWAPTVPSLANRVILSAVASASTRKTVAWGRDGAPPMNAGHWKPRLLSGQGSMMSTVSVCPLITAVILPASRRGQTVHARGVRRATA